MVRVNTFGPSSDPTWAVEDNVVDLNAAEVREIHSAIQATQSEQAITLRDLQARAEDAVVNIEGEQFPLLTFVAGYVVSNNAASHSLKFVDAMSLLEVVTAMSQTFADNIDLQFCGGRVNMECPSNQKVLYLFQLTAPTTFAGNPDKARSNRRSLSAFKNYNAFKGTCLGDSGAVNELLRLIDDKTTAFATEIRTLDMSATAKILAKTLLDNSKRFLVTLLTFMERRMKEYRAETNLSETRRWELVQAIVPIVFGVISKARRSCSEITIREATSPA